MSKIHFKGSNVAISLTSYIKVAAIDASKVTEESLKTRILSSGLNELCENCGQPKGYHQGGHYKCPKYEEIISAGKIWITDYKKEGISLERPMKSGIYCKLKGRNIIREELLPIHPQLGMVWNEPFRIVKVMEDEVLAESISMINAYGSEQITVAIHLSWIKSVKVHIE